MCTCLLLKESTLSTKRTWNERGVRPKERIEAQSGARLSRDQDSRKGRDPRGRIVDRTFTTDDILFVLATVRSTLIVTVRIN